MHLTSIDKRSPEPRNRYRERVSSRLMGIVLVSKSAVRETRGADRAGIRARSNNGKSVVLVWQGSSPLPTFLRLASSLLVLLPFSSSAALAYYYRFLRSRGSFVTWCCIVVKRLSVIVVDNGLDRLFLNTLVIAQSAVEK